MYSLGCTDIDECATPLVYLSAQATTLRVQILFLLVVMVPPLAEQQDANASQVQGCQATLTPRLISAKTLCTK